MERFLCRMSRGRIRTGWVICGLGLVGHLGSGRVWAAETLAPVVAEFSADVAAVEASFGIPFAEESWARRSALLKEWEQRLEEMNFEELTVDQRVDWHLLKLQVGAEESGLGLERARLEEMQVLLDFRKPLLAMLAAHQRRSEVDPGKVAGELAEVTASLKRLRKKPDPPAGGGSAGEAPATVLLKGRPALAVRTAEAMDRIRRAMEEWFGFYNGFQPDFGWWVRQPHGALVQELKESADWLRKELAGLKGDPGDPLVGDPIGEEALKAQLRAECLPYSAAELVVLAEKELAWCTEQMALAARELGAENPAAALTRVKEEHAPPGGQPALTAAKALQAIQFVKDRDLVGIPALAEETWRLSMLGVEQQKTLPYAVYGAPEMRMAYAHESMSHEEKRMAMRGNNASFLHIVTPHELIPGHHLQLYQSRRLAPHRQLFRTPFLIEGWALHWEMLLWDLGYAASPQEKIGTLFWRMHRCARIIVSLRFHLGEMTPAAMVDFLVDRVGHERSGAVAEVRRYIGGSYGPLYQAAYMIGGLQLRALYAEMTRPGPDGTIRQTPRQFHDAVLGQGPIPIELIRAALRKEALRKDWESSWRFSGGR